MQAFCIADRRHTIFDGIGARLLGGRWNSPGRATIYASESYALAVLEVLVHANFGRLPRTHAFVEIAIPDSVSIERLELAPKRMEDARAFGDRWLAEGRSCVLLVPSAVVGGRGLNVLLNPAHPEMPQVHATPPQAIEWDARLFGGQLS